MGAGDEGAQLGRGELQSRAIKGASWTVIHTLVSVPIAFVVNIVIARVLGVVDYGRLAFLSSVMDVVSGVLSATIGIGVVQFGSMAHAAGRRDEVREILSKSQGFRLLVEAPIVIIVVLLIAQVSPSMLFVATFFGVLMPAAFSGAAACLGIENKTAQMAQNAMIVNIITQLSVLAAAFLVGTADTIWAARLAAGGLAIAMALIWIDPTYRRAVLRPRLPWRFPAGFWKFALPAGMASVIGSFVVSRTEVLALTWMQQYVAAGTFALAFGLAAHLFSPAQALIGPLIPAVAGLRAVDSGAIRPAFDRTIRAASTLIGLMVAVGAPAFAVLIPIIYGSDFATASLPFILLCIASAAGVLSGPVQAFTQSRLAGWSLVRVNSVALAIDILVVLLALVPAIGIWGAVAANATAAVARVLMLVRLELRDLGMSWMSFLRGVVPFCIGAVSCLVSWIIVDWTAWNLAVEAVVSAALGLGMLLVGLRALRSGFRQDDADAMVAAMPVRLKKIAAHLLGLLVNVRPAGDGD